MLKEEIIMPDSMSPVVSIKNKASVELDDCEELIAFDSNEVEAHYLDIEITKSQSCIWAIHGKNLTYCVDITSRTGHPIDDLKFVDVLDYGVQYVTGTFKVGDDYVTPMVSGQTLSYVIPHLDPNQKITICFQVKVL